MKCEAVPRRARRLANSRLESNKKQEELSVRFDGSFFPQDEEEKQVVLDSYLRKSQFPHKSVNLSFI